MDTEGDISYRPRLILTSSEWDLINEAKDYAKQTRASFVTKAAVDRAERLLTQKQRNEEGIEEALANE